MYHSVLEKSLMQGFAYYQKYPGTDMWYVITSHNFMWT